MKKNTDTTVTKFVLQEEYFEGEKLDFSKILQSFQDVAVFHLKAFKNLQNELEQKNLAFIIIQNAIKSFAKAKPNQMVTLKSKMFAPNLNRCDRKYELFDESGNLILSGFSKWCLLDNNLRKSVEMKRVNIPIVLKDFSDEKQYKLEKNITKEKDFVFEYVVKEKDIDFNNHMNNVAYMNIIEKVAKLFDFNYNNLVINYLKECLLDDKLEIRAVLKEEALIVEGYYDKSICFVCKIEK